MGIGNAGLALAFLTPFDPSLSSRTRCGLRRWSPCGACAGLLGHHTRGSNQAFEPCGIGKRRSIIAR